MDRGHIKQESKDQVQNLALSDQFQRPPDGCFLPCFPHTFVMCFLASLAADGLLVSHQENWNGGVGVGGISTDSSHTFSAASISVLGVKPRILHMLGKHSTRDPEL